MKKINWKLCGFYLFCAGSGALVGTLIGASWWLVLAIPGIMIFNGTLGYFLLRPKKEENLKP